MQLGVCYKRENFKKNIAGEIPAAPGPPLE